MAGTKRKGDEAGVSTRSGDSKVAKKAPDSKPKSKGKPESKAKAPAKKGGPKAPATAHFKKHALPLHVNITHTPPPIADDKESAAVADPGFLGGVSLQPATFATGSYGWKGSKRLQIELDGGDGKEKVHVMLNINATVMGSKAAGKDEEGGEVEGEADDAKENGAAEEEEAAAEE